MGTHTYAELEVSQQTYDEIRDKLKQAGYDYAFMDSGVIDMHGIGLSKKYDTSIENVSKQFFDILHETINTELQKQGRTFEEFMRDLPSEIENLKKLVKLEKLNRG